MLARIGRDIPDSQRPRLVDLFWIFFGIACTSFGGYMAMISAVQQTIVDRRRLLRDQDMLDGISLASVLPGPNAINVVAYAGYRLRGAVGAVVCVCAALLPAFMIMLVLSEMYLVWGRLPVVSRVFMGLASAVAAIIVAAAWRMGRSSLVTIHECMIAGVAAVFMLTFPGIFATLAVVLTAALAGRLWFGENTLARAAFPLSETKSVWKTVLRINPRVLAFAALPIVLMPLPGFEYGVLMKLCSAFGGMGLLMFGGGYSFIPMFHKAVVDGYGWVTHQELVDALALGQVTPRPVMISVVFIGYKVAGLAGALAATVGMFAPPAMLTVFCASLVDSAGASQNMQACMRGLRAAATGMVFSAAVLVCKSVATEWLSIAMMVASLVLLLRYRFGSASILLIAGAAGFFFYQG